MGSSRIPQDQTIKAGCNVEEYQSIGDPVKSVTFELSSIVTEVRGKHPQN